MIDNETTQSTGEIDKEAQRIAAEHKSLAELREIVKNKMFEASTREGRLSTGNAYEAVVQRGREHITRAQQFSADNLTELKELAEQSAAADGKTIEHYEEEPLFLEDIEAYREILDKIETSENFLQGDPRHSVAANRLKLDLLETYITERGISMADLRPQDIEILGATPEWQNATDQGARIFNDLVVDKAYDKHRAHEKSKRAIKAFVEEREEMDARLKSVEESF